jgi:hypothetical protein
MRLTLSDIGNQTVKHRGANLEDCYAASDFDADLTPTLTPTRMDVGER